MDRRLSRRQLIGGAAAVTGGALLTRQVSRSDSSAGAASRGRILVLGGELAGLTAAYELERAGFDTQLLEACDRLGGRVHTVRDFTDGQHGESGAEAIDTKQLEIQRLCRRLGLPLEHAYSGYGSRTGTIYRRGRSYPGFQFRTREGERQIGRFWREIERLARPLDGNDPTAHGGARQDPYSVAGSKRLSGDTYSVAWKAEPYSGGCWATYAPDQISKHWLGLHKPTGPIHWAGEHTEKLNGYMNSAVAPSERVASKIDRA